MRRRRRPEGSVLPAQQLPEEIGKLLQLPFVELAPGGTQKLHSLALDTMKSRNTVTRLVSFSSSG
jgi:hypothetical protein